MATIDPSVQKDTDYNYLSVTWDGLESGDDGREVSIFGAYKNKTVQITGTMDGATPTLEGSMDGENWETLTSDGSTAISGEGLFAVYEHPEHIRPNVDGGASATSVTVILGMPASSTG